jgi:hypothetical protein
LASQYDPDMRRTLFDRLHKEGLVSDLSVEKIKIAALSQFFSVHWELKTLLYLGILLLTGGLGVLVYKNIDTIGHQAILAAIGLLCVGSFVYCEKKKLPFSASRVFSPNAFFDYVVLLGCLSLITFITYLQVQYTAFGTAYGLAIFIPMIILFFSAYYFDHIGVLSMAITNLAAWMGIAVTPLTILKNNDFSDANIIIAGVALGIFLIVAAIFSEKKKIKAHFSFTYLNFGMNIFFIACLAGMFHFENIYLLWILPLAAGVYYFYRQAVLRSSFYFILMMSVYVYIALGYVVIRILDNINEGYILGLMYFIASGIAMILFMIRMNKKLKHDPSL